MKQIALLVCITMYCMGAHAQYNAPQNNVWTFGTNALVNFSSGTPVAGTSSINTVEGSASVANSSGALLFYSDGKTVYNRTGAVMPSGASVVPAYVVSTTQAAVIVPFVTDTAKYYLFSLSYATFSPWSSSFKLSYSVIDMSLDGGMGDVVPGTANTFLADSLSEKMIAIAGNNCNVWLLVHKPDTTLFYVYEINANGVNLPTIYNVGGFNPPPAAEMYGNGYHLGTMKSNHSRTQLFLSCVQAINPRGIGELYDFNPSTGVVSNCRKITNDVALYDAEFSPDDSKIYVNNLDLICIEQYDLSLPTLAAITASRIKVSDTCKVATGVKLGPDGRIYTATIGSNFLDYIPYPNAAGLACGYVRNAIDISPGWVNMCLPNLVWKVSGVSPLITGPSEVCVGDTITLYNSGPGGQWFTSDFTIAGSYPDGKIVGVSAGVVTITYQVLTEEGEGCYATTTVTVIECETSVTQMEANNAVDIYPVPTNNNVTVAFASHIAGAKITLYDMAGRQVLTTGLTNKVSQINLSEVPPGIYTCTISNNNKAILARKLIVKR